MGGKQPVLGIFWKTVQSWSFRPEIWPKLFFGGKPQFFCFFFEKNPKSGGKPPISADLWKNRKIRLKTTRFDGFFKKPVNRVVFHHFSGFSKKPEKWWFSTQIWPFSIPRKSCLKVCYGRIFVMIVAVVIVYKLVRKKLLILNIFKIVSM